MALRQDSSDPRKTADRSVGEMIREFNELIGLLTEVVADDTRNDPGLPKISDALTNWTVTSLEFRKIMHRFATAENFFREHYESLDAIRDARTGILRTYGTASEDISIIPSVIAKIEAEKKSLTHDLEKLRRRRKDQENMARVVTPKQEPVRRTRLSRDEKKLRQAIIDYMETVDGECVLLSDVGDMLSRTNFKINGKLKAKCESLGFVITETNTKPPIVSIVKPDEIRKRI